MQQVVWAKLLVQLIGATAYAQTVVLGTFMVGLAMGSLWLGRLVDRRGRPLRTYVTLQLLIGVYCLLLPLLVSAASSGYVSLAGRFFESAGLTRMLRLTLAVLVVLLPAVLMGGTLPILARHLIDRLEKTRNRVGALYALNSLGAVLGAGMAGFLTLPRFGIQGSLSVACTLNLAAAALVARRAWREEPIRVAAPKLDSPAGGKSYTAAVRGVAVFALIVSGFAAMGYEVLFIRIISLAFGSSTYSFTVMLMSFISGISLGSALVSRLKVRHPLWLLGVSQLLVVTALLAATPLVSRLPYLVGLLRIAFQDTAGGFELFQLGKAALCLAVLLLPTACLGFTFPLVAQIQARRVDRIGWHVGSTYAWNSLGNVLGVVITSLILLPALGLLGAFHFNLALNASAGFALLAFVTEVNVARRWAAAAAACCVALAYGMTGTGWSEPLNLAAEHLRLRTAPGETDFAHPASSFEAWKRSYVIEKADHPVFHFEEDAHSAVLAYGDGNGEGISLYVNGKPEAGTGADLSTQLLLAHAPLFVAPAARSLLVIGHGSGITAGSAMRDPIERADIVEISGGVLRTNSVFAAENYGVLEDPRVRVHLDDGQSFLRSVPRSYDAIISVPTNPWIAGVGGLFTVEFFETVRAKLNPGGVFSFGFHEYEQSEASVKLVLRTLGSVFPHVMLFREFDFWDVVAVASVEPIEPDFAAMERRFDEPDVRNDLARIGFPNLATWLSTHAVSQARFSALTGEGPLNTAARQRLEYVAPRSFFHDERSNLVQTVDALAAGLRGTDLLLDRYIRYRKTTGDPVSKEELGLAAEAWSTQQGLGQLIADALTVRANSALARGGPASRPARGALADPASMGLYEAAHWARHYNVAGGSEAAIPFYRRALELRTTDTPSPLAQVLRDSGDSEAIDAELRACIERDRLDLDAILAEGWDNIFAWRARNGAIRSACLVPYDEAPPAPLN